MINQVCAKLREVVFNDFVQQRQNCTYASAGDTTVRLCD